MAGTEVNTEALDHLTLHCSSQDHVITHQDHVTHHVTLSSQPWHIPEYSDEENEEP